MSFNFFNKIRGFTLIEMLAAIVIISIIFSIIIVIYSGYTSNANDTSTAINKENILDSAVIYINEMKKESSWMVSKVESTKKYICVKVNELINYGYLNKNVYDTYFELNKDSQITSDTLIKVVRNSNKVIESKDFVSSEDEECSDYLSEIPIINYSITSFTNVINVNANCDAGSSTKISNYLFSINGNEFVDNGLNNEYSFADLKDNTTYNIGIKCITDKRKESSVAIKTNTEELKTPTYSIQQTSNVFSSSRYVDIKYDNSKVNTPYNIFKVTGNVKSNKIVYKCSDPDNIDTCTQSIPINTEFSDGVYRIDDTSIRLIYSTNGYLDISISDGTNTKYVSNIEINNIDTTNPIIGLFELVDSKYNVVNDNYYYSLIKKMVKIEDKESGIKEVKYCFTTSSSCTPNTLGKLENDSLIIEFSSAKSSKQKVCVLATDNSGRKTTRCDDTSYYFDNTPPSSITFSRYDISSYQKKFKLGNTDKESGFWKYEFLYSIDGKEWNLDHESYSNSIYQFIQSRLESKRKYYVKLIVYNKAGLSKESSILEFTPYYNPYYIYNDLSSCDDLYNKEVYFKYGDYLYFVYDGADKAVLNGFYKLSSVNNRFTYLQNFINELPSNYTDILDMITSPTGYLYIEGDLDFISYDHIYDTSFSSYVSLPEHYNYAEIVIAEKRIKNYDGWGKIYWYTTSTYWSSYSILGGWGGIKIDSSLLTGTYNEIYPYGRSYINKTYFCSYYGNSSIYYCANSYVRPIIDLKEDVEFISGDGTRDNPFVIEG